MNALFLHSLQVDTSCHVVVTRLSRDYYPFTASFLSSILPIFDEEYSFDITFNQSLHDIISFSNSGLAMYLGWFKQKEIISPDLRMSNGLMW